MLAKLDGERWWYMEVPRTGSSTIERTLKHLYPHAKAVYAKHWPILPPEGFLDARPLSVVSIRNPYSRAISCWQYFTRPGEISFLGWTEQRLKEGWFDVHIEARPQAFWLKLWDWDVQLRQEHLSKDFWSFVHSISPTIEKFDLHRYNDINGHWVNRVRAKTSRERPWQEYYCPESERNVLELYGLDFEILQDHYSKTFPGNVVLS